jgi:2-oxoglutarate dehydrogenase E1 component
MAPRLETALDNTEHHKGKGVAFAGRIPTSSVATGNKYSHANEIAKYLEAALG